MNDIDTPRLVYLVLLLTVIGGFYLIEQRKQLGQTLRYGLIWGLIFLGAVAGVGLWKDVKNNILERQTTNSDGAIVVPRASDGHFYLQLVLNDTPVRFMIDTGASRLVLTREDAQKIGLNPDALAFDEMASTANGVVATDSVWIKTVELGDLRDFDMPASVNGGELDVSLLGMEYLSRFRRMEMTGNRLILER